MRGVKSPPGAGAAQDKVFTRAFFVLCSTNFLMFMTVYSLLVTLPVYAVTRLGGSEGLAGVVTAAISFVPVLILPYLGRLVDRFGRTPFMRLGLGILLAETLAMHFVSWFPLLVVIGMFWGAALAMFQTGSATMIADLAPVHRRGEAMGIFGTFTTTAVAVSPAVSTIVMLNNGFETLFVMSSVLAGAAIILSLLLREPGRKIELSPTGPLLAPAALLPGLCIFSVSLTYGTLISFLPGYAPKVGLENAGLFFTVFALSSLLVRALAGSLSDRVGRAPVMMPALLLVAAGMLLLGQTNNPAIVLATAALYGLGYGSTHPTAMAMCVDRAGQSERASAVATFNVSYNLGMVVGSLAMGFLLTSTSFAVMAAVAGGVPLLATIPLYLGRARPAAPVC